MTSTDPLEQAQNPLTTPATLDRLAQHEDPTIRLAVSQNPATLGDTLTKLLEEEFLEIGEAVCAHPHLPVALQEALSDAQNPQTLPARWDSLAQHPAWRVRCFVAQTLPSGESLLELLSRDANVYVRTAVAARGGLPLALAERLSLDLEPGVRYHLLSDENLADALLEHLAKDSEEAVSRLAHDRQRDRRRNQWTEEEAKQALLAGQAGDLDALADVGIFRLNTALEGLPSGSAIFVQRFVFPDSEEADLLREALGYLLTAASGGQEQAQYVLDSLAEDDLYNNPAVKGKLFVDLPYLPGVDELLPSRVEVRLQGSLIENYDYINPEQAALYLTLLGFGWTDPSSVSSGFDEYNEDPELDLEDLDEDRYDPQTLLYDFTAGWSLIEELSEEAAEDPRLAVMCLGLLVRYASLGHARSSVVFRTLIQLKAQFERGGS